LVVFLDKKYKKIIRRKDKIKREIKKGKRKFI